MDHFIYKNKKLFAENVSVENIVEEVETPFYLYSKATLQRHFRILDEALKLKNKLICFAVKANSNISVLKSLIEEGAGADVVSQGEIYRALQAGCDPKKIVFSGVAKTREEIRYALQEEVLQFNCESREEIIMIDEEAAKLREVASIAIRINPDVDAKTIAEISTGKKGNKFGVDIDKAENVIEFSLALQNINLQSISVHIGSQITELEPFEKAFRKTFSFVQEIEKKFSINLPRIDLGGGIGVPYGDNEVIEPQDYGKLVTDLVAEFSFLEKIIMFEPGRLIAANAGILVTKVILVKETEHTNFAMVDSAMNDFKRPCLYGAKPVFIANEQAQATDFYDVVGPVCESTDIFSKNTKLPKLQEGSILAIRSTGAYGAVMASEYNSRPLIPEIMVDGDEFKIIRRRRSLKEMLELEAGVQC